MSQNTQIYVRGYPKKVGEQDLKKFYSRFGSVKAVKLLKDFAFVTFSSAEEAKEAVSKTNGSTEFQTQLIVQIAKEPAVVRRCRNCDEEGHTSNLCPKPKTQRKFKEQKRKRSSSSSESESSSKDRRKKKKSKKSRKISKRRRSSRSSSSSSSSSHDRKRSSRKR